MTKLQNLNLNEIKPFISIRDYKNNKFLEFNINQIRKWLPNKIPQSRIAETFSGYYFVPKSTDANGIAGGVTHLISFDSYPFNQIQNWTLSFGDGHSIQSEALTNFELLEKITATSNVFKAKLIEGTEFNVVPKSGYVLIDGEYIKYLGVTNNFQSNNSEAILNSWKYWSGAVTNLNTDIKFGIDKIVEDIPEVTDKTIQIKINDINNFPLLSGFKIYINDEAFSVKSTPTLISGDLNPIAQGIGRTNAASTYITQDIDINSETIVVDSTANFPASGTILIDDEHIRYFSKTSTTFEELERGANDTEIATHAVTVYPTDPTDPSNLNTNVVASTKSTKVENLTFTNFINSDLSKPFMVNETIKSSTNGYIADGTIISAIEESSYSTGEISQINSRTVTGIGTEFNVDMVGGTLVYSDGSKAKIIGYTSPTQLKVNKTKTSGQYKITKATASGKNYTYTIDSLHHLVVGDTVTITGMANGDITGFRVTTQIGTNQSGHKNYKKAILTVKNTDIFNKLKTGVTYNIYSSNIPNKSNITFTVNGTIPEKANSKTYTITLSNVTGVPDGEVKETVAYISRSGNCAYNVTNAKVKTVTPYSFTVNGNISGLESANADAGYVTVPQSYEIKVSELTLSKPALKTGTGVSVYIPGEDVHQLELTRSVLETSPAYHPAGSIIRQFVVYNGQPYLANATHTNTEPPKKHSKYWLPLDNKHFVFYFSNLQRGYFTTTAAAHLAHTHVKAVQKVVHYYKYDGGNSQNGAASVLLTGIDNYNRKFKYNTVVYPKTDLPGYTSPPVYT